MYFYLAQYSVLCILSLIDQRKISNKIYFLVYLILLITIGFRYEVGGDWGTYLQNYRNLTLDKIGIETFFVREPGWLLLSYISKFISYNEIYPLNLMSAAIFLSGLISFCAGTKKKYFALAISYPILIILVGMGYTRQSIAMGFCFLSFKYLFIHKSVWKFTLFSIFAFAFHNTAIFFSIVIYLFNRDDKFFRNLLISTICIVLIILCTPFGSHFLTMINEYIFLSSYRASGAISRGIPIFISALGFLIMARYIDGKLNFNKGILFILIGIFLFMLLIDPFAALDRIYLYFSMIYIYFLSNLKIDKYSYSNLIYEVIVLIIFFIYIIIWFTYGVNYSFWEPYNNYLKYISP